MSAKQSSARILELPLPGAGEPAQDSGRPYAATLVEATAGGELVVRDEAGRTHACDWLTGSGGAGPRLDVGDRVLVQPLGGASRPVVMGRIGRYLEPQTTTLVPHLTIESADTLSLKCGEASIDLRADGKVMIRGGDVLVRAKGTQRIRAGSVSIN